MGDFLFVFLVVGGLSAFFYYKGGDNAEHTAVEEAVVEEAEHSALTWRVLQRVLENPGILQVELYKLFPHENRKQLQSTLLQLDKENVLKREKEGNSYRLFPV